MKHIRIGALCAAFIVASPAWAAPRFTLQTVPAFQVPGTGTSDAWYARLDGFNDSGQIASTWYDSGYGTYLYTPGVGYESMMPASTAPGSQQPYGRELNNRGELAAELGSAAYVLRTGGNSAPVPGTAGTYSGARAINDRGDVAGFRVSPEGTFRPFVHTAAGFRTLPYDGGWAYDINNNGQVLGENGTQRQVWIHDLSTGSSTPVDIRLEAGDGAAFLNDQGEVAMEATRGNAGREIYRYREGRISEVDGIEGNTANVLNDFNNRGWVLGLSALDVAGRTAYESFLDLPGEGSFALESLVDPVSLAGWSEIGGLRLNDRGDIAGGGLFGGTLRLFVLTSAPMPMVPEPGTAWLALAGLALLARRRR